MASVAPPPLQVAFKTPYSEGVQVFPTFKPWLDSTDGENILFARQAGRFSDEDQTLTIKQQLGGPRARAGPCWPAFLLCH